MKLDDEIINVLPGPLVDDDTEFVFVGNKQHCRAFVNAAKHEEVVSRHVAQADNLVKALRFYAEKDAWGPSDPHKGLPRVDLDEGDVARAALDDYETEDR